MSGYFRLDVDAAGMRGAAETLGRLSGAVGGEAAKLRVLVPGLSASFTGQAASALETEAANLGEAAGRAELLVGDAARALTTLADRYDLAVDVELPELNRRWEAAGDAYAEALRLAESGSSSGSGTDSGISTSGTGGTGGTGVDPGAALATAVAATATMDAERERIQTDYDSLREQLRSATRTASDVLARSVVVPVQASAVASYSGGGFFGAFNHLFASMPDPTEVFAGSLPLTALQWARRDPPGPEAGSEALGQLLATARANGLEPREYRNLLSAYYQALAFEHAGIDPAAWDPEAGAFANQDIIFAVYRYYGDLFLEHPELQWAGMANMIGPSFAAGFFDLASLRDFAGRIADLPGAATALAPGSLTALRALAGASEAELRFFETAFLSMQREIFVDQAPMHEAYLAGGVPAIEEMAQAGLIDTDALTAWSQISDGARSGDAALVAEGNTRLLRREQFDIIADDYDRMRNHHGPVGQGFTYAMTVLGAPSIPGAQSFGEVFPLQATIDTPGPDRIGTPDRIGIPGFSVDIPDISVDNPLEGEVIVTTPLPDGNISQRDERWALVSQDTLPAYQRLLATDPELARQLAATPVADRVEDYRLRNQVDEILRRLADWDVEFRQ